MDLITILRKAIKSEQYSEGLKDALAFLEKEGQGIGMLRELVKSIQKDESTN